MKFIPVFIFIFLASVINTYSQSWDKTFELSAGSGTPMDRYGESVSISDDGDLIAVSAIGYIVDNKAEQGKVFIYGKDQAGWTLQSEILASDGQVKDNFGMQLNLSGDGSTLLVGAQRKTIDTNNYQGKVYVFSRNGNKWDETASLIAYDGAASDQFGYSVGLSDDGTTAIVGATKANGNRGKAYVYFRTGSTWELQGELVAPIRTAGDAFGGAIKLTADGNIAFVSAYRKGTIGVTTQQGYVYVFTRTGTSWNYLATIQPSDKASYDHFGTSLDASSDGKILVIGSLNKKLSNLDGVGKAYYFEKEGNNWIERSSFTAPDAAEGDYFGIVSLSDDGNTLLIGAGHKYVDTIIYQGKVYAYLKSGDEFVLKDEVFSGEPVHYDYFGADLAISGNGKTAVIAAPLRRTGDLTPQGEIYIYSNNLITEARIKNDGKHHFVVYPNPTDKQVNLVSEQFIENIRLELFSSDGRLIDVSNYFGTNRIDYTVMGPNGVYLIKVFNDSEYIDTFKLEKR
ncbi:MAG: T9SS type A sorting domain-containing protein [Sporocytophaga sp.]|nr:T9SS type A sorting domain-containing protein [Sporocytophaga sp.]